LPMDARVDFAEQVESPDLASQHAVRACKIDRQSAARQRGSERALEFLRSRRRPRVWPSTTVRSGDGFGRVDEASDPDSEPSTVTSLLRLAPSIGRSWETHLRHKL